MLHCTCVLNSAIDLTLSLLLQKLRGQGYNVIHIDEANFLQPTIYQELWPMLSTDKGRMIIMSSQKTTQDNRDFIDVSALRSSHVTSNHVYYVCPPHLKEMSANRCILNVCLCYIFSQPHHINTGGSYKALTELFTRNNCSNEDNDKVDSAMLSELGVDISSINDDIQEMSLPSLCTKKARIQLQTSMVCVLDIIKEQKGHSLLSDTVMVYIDPAPVSGDRSFNAICFATHVTHVLSEDTSHKYIILAVENFQSDVFDPDTNNYGIAAAKILMRDIADIYSFYRGHFKYFVIAPEADSISMDHFWVKCQQLYVENTMFFAKNGPRIFFTTVKISLNKRVKDSIIKNYHECMRDDGLLTHDEINGFTVKGKLSNVHKNSLFDHRKCRNLEAECVQYRIGYNLGQNKTKIYLDFFATEYNALNIFCAAEIFGHTLSSKKVSIPTFIAENLDLLTIKSSGKSRTSWKINGKKQQNGVFIADDVADAVIMSIMLFKQAVNEGKSRSPLYELKPEITSHGSIKQFQKQDYVIMST